MVTYVPYSMGRMEYNWGPDAASFIPERWFKDGVLQNESPFKFSAFQASSSVLESMIVSLKLEPTCAMQQTPYIINLIFFCIYFQAGPRICLGKDSAYLQMRMVLAILCRFYKFNLVPGHPVKYRMMTLLSMAHGLKLTIEKRP